MSRHRVPVRLAFAILLLVLLPALLAWGGSPYLGRLAQVVLVAIVLTGALNLLVGTAGLLALDTVVFYGLGAYTAAILSVNSGTSFLTDVAAAVVLTSVIGAICGFALVRLTSIFFAVATMALAISFTRRC
jgi:branched-chain amino acid transport system permease protein